jgi:leader peptidase (prepilin peptidase)/N-methyltransferase
MTYFLFFGVGLLVGSFLNVVIFRLETGETVVSGRSRCNACRKTIVWYDNIPLISYMLLRGKCRKCGAKISFQYPLVELATGLLFLATAQHFFAPENVSAAIETVFVLGLIAALTVIFVYDFRHMEIPVPVLQFGILWTVIALGAMDFFSPFAVDTFSQSHLGAGLIGGAAAFFLFWLLVFFSKETWMGWGDVWLALILGLALGWQLVLPALTFAFGTGALIGLVLIALRKKSMQSRIPFGPFLVASVIFMLFFGILVEERFRMW